MTVVVGYDNGRKIYRSLGVLGSSEEDREKADKLDIYIRDKVNTLKESFKKENISLDKTKTGNVYIYWRLGKLLYELLYKSELVDPAEKSLLWLNAKIYLPGALLKENRGPDRNHLEYCFRLGKFSREKAEKMKWGEWVYLFDSPGINKEKRFDAWFENIIEKKSVNLGRENIRIFVQCLNNMIGNIETDDLSDEELFRCYDAAWELKSGIYNYIQEMDNGEFKQILNRLRRGIKQNYTKIGEVMESNISPLDFAITILDSIKK